MRVGINFPGELPGRFVLQAAKLAESHGLDSVWIGEHYFQRDAITVASSVAATTERIGIGLCVINPYTRNPALAAMTIASLDEISGGRAILGLGRSIRQWMEPMGIRYQKPITSMREFIHLTRLMLSGERVSFDGRVYKHVNVGLGFKPLRGHVPIFIAAMGPKMLRLAGEIADGVILGSGLPRAYLVEALERVGEGLRASSRTRGQFTVALCALTSIAEESKAARSAIRPLLGRFIALNLFADPTLYERSGGAPGAEAKKILDTFLKAGPEAAAQHVTDEMVDELSIAGTPGEFREKAAEYRDLGVDLLILNFPAQSDYRQMIALVASTL